MKTKRLQEDFRRFLISTAIAIFTTYNFMGGFAFLNPLNHQWISGDNTSGFIAQLFYISDRWRFPLASNPHFGLDLSQSLVYSGPPIPFLLVQKLLRISADLQFIGLWLLVVVILQIFFGSKIGYELGLTFSSSIILGCLYITPFFLNRFQVHYWLTSHFLILWSILLLIRYLKTRNLSTMNSVFLVIFAYSINTYLLVMVFLVLLLPILLEVLNRSTLNNHEFRRKRIVTHLFCLISSLIFAYIVFDFPSRKIRLYENFRMNFTGDYSRFPYNLISAINPRVGYSRNCLSFFCPYPETLPSDVIDNFSTSNLDLGGVQGDFDGYLYLGLGVIFLLFILILVLMKEKSGLPDFLLTRQGKVSFLYLFSILAYAVTYRITISTFQLDVEMPKLIRWGLSVFRASGRFMWINAYVLIAFIVYLMLKFFSQKKLLLVLSIALAIQVIDVGPPLLARSNQIRLNPISSFHFTNTSSKQFANIAKGHSTFLVLPAYSQKGWPDFAYLAWKNGLASGLFQSSRINYFQAERDTKRIIKSFCSGNMDNGWLLAVPLDELDLIKTCDWSPYKDVDIGSHKFFFRRTR